MLHQHHSGHQHHHMEKRQDRGTVVQYIYQTAAKTFDGPVGGYSTVNAPEPQSTPQSGADTSNSNSEPGSNSNSNADSDTQQEEAQQQAAIQSSSSAAVAAQLAEASSSAVAAAEASMEQAATQSTPTPTPAVPSQAQIKEQVQATPQSTSEKTEAAIKQTSMSTSIKKVATQPLAAATSSSSVEVAASPTSSFIESTTSSTPTNSAAPSSGASSGSSSGMSGGAKAGLAIGILLAIGLLIGGIFLCYRRRKKHSNEDVGKVDDEKSPYGAGLARAQSTTSTRTTATAPRLSLRPVTQFLPDLAARGTAANAAGAGAAAIGGAPMTTRDHNDPANPFGSHAEVTQPSQSIENEKSAPIQVNAPENPFADSALSGAPIIDGPLPPTADVPAPLRVRTPTPETAAAAGVGAVAAGATVVAGAKLAAHPNAPKPLNLSPNRSVSPAASSPVGSEFSQTPVSPGAFANGPPPSNVHRIQLDFKPSMDDELSLRAGQLVRLLHEYDDGWALCIRLDRSQQGVAPRTCLSARPVKPRPPPGARGPGPRGPPPRMMTPGQQRPASPASGRGSPAPLNRTARPPGPGPNGSQQRSMSPGPYGGGPQRPAMIPPPGGKPRSNSASEIREQRNSPPGPSPMNPNTPTPTTPNTQRVPMQLQSVTSPDQALSQSPPQTMARKPVPGQAM